jgi:hypothetical protein
VRSLADHPVALGLALVALLAACAEPMASPTASPTPVSPAATPMMPTPASAEPSPASPEPSPAGLELPDPGRPFDAAGLLREMEGSTRPGGVPEPLRTLAVAGAIADAVWTFDGSSWDTIAVSGYCGTSSCTVELAGTRLGDAGEDLWILEVDPAGPAVRVAAAELRALPADLAGELDAIARSADRDGRLESMMLGTARWLPPPDGDRFVLSYRTGSVEGSCRREVTVDAVRAEVVETTATNC